MKCILIFSFGKSSSFSSLQGNKKNKIKCQVDLLFVVINTQAFVRRWSWVWKQVLPVVVLSKAVLRPLKGQMSKHWKSQLQPVAFGQCPSAESPTTKEGQHKAWWLRMHHVLAALDPMCEETTKKGRADFFRAEGNDYLKIRKFQNPTLPTICMLSFWSKKLHEICLWVRAM